MGYIINHALRLRVDDMVATCRQQFGSLPLCFARFGHARFACTHVMHVLIGGVLEKGQPGPLVRVGPCARKTTNPSHCKCRACFNSGLVDGHERAVQRTARQLPNLYLYSYTNNNLSIYLYLSSTTLIKTELVMMVCLPSCNIGRLIYI